MSNFRLNAAKKFEQLLSQCEIDLESIPAPIVFDTIRYKFIEHLVTDRVPYKEELTIIPESVSDFLNRYCGKVVVTDNVFRVTLAILIIKEAIVMKKTEDLKLLFDQLTSSNKECKIQSCLREKYKTITLKNIHVIKRLLWSPQQVNLAEGDVKVITKRLDLLDDDVRINRLMRQSAPPRKLLGRGRRETLRLCDLVKRG